MRQLFLNKRQIIVCVCVFAVVLLHVLWFQEEKVSIDTYSYPDYEKEYQEYRERVEQKNENNREISIFRESDSIAAANAKKTFHDYEQSAEVEIVPLHGTQDAVSNFINYDGTMLAGCGIMLFLIFSTQRRKESCMRILEFSLPRGRRLLALIRTSSILGSVFLFSFLLQIVVITISFCRFGGWQDLSAPIQSVPMFLTMCQPFSIAQFLIAYCGIRAVALCAFGILLLALLWVIDHKILTLFFWMLFLIGEYLLYQMIPIQGRWIGIKLLNLIYLLLPQELLLIYRNIKTPFGLLELKELYVWLMIGCFIIGMSVIVWVSGKRSLNVMACLKNKVANLIDIMMFLKANLEQKLSWVWMEIYGFFILQKGWILCAIFMTLIVFSFQKDHIVYAGESKYLQAFYQEWEGPLTEELQKHMEDWKKELSLVEEKWQKTTQDYVSGKISFDEYDNARYWYESYQVPRKCYVVLSEQVERLEELAKNTGKEMWLVNEVGYGYLLGMDSTKKQVITELLIYLLAILSCLSIAKGKELIPYNLQRSFPFGRTRLYAKKFVAGMIVIIVFGTTSKILHLLYVLRSYGVSAWQAPIQSLRAFSDTSFTGNILMFYVLKTLGQIGSYLAVGSMIFLFWFIMRCVKK